MARLYKEQATVDRSPKVPETGLITAFEKKRQAGVDALGSQAEHLDKVQVQKEKTLYTNMEIAGKQIYKNAYELFPHQSKEYEEFVGKGLKEVYSQFPDSEEKMNIMAKVSISGTGYNASVQKNVADDREKLWWASVRDNSNITLDSAQQGLSGFFSGKDKALGLEEKTFQKAAFDDAKMNIEQEYSKRNMLDSGGNFVYSVTERARRVDLHDNMYKYALIGYAGKNIQNNREGVIKTRNGLVEDRDLLVKQHGFSNEDIQDAITEMDKVISGQSTGDDIIRDSTIRSQNEAVVKGMKIQSDGSVKNKEYNNIDSIMRESVNLDASAGSYTSTAEKKKWAKQKGDVSRALLKQIKDGAKLSKEARGKGGMFKLIDLKETVAETAVSEVKKNMDFLKGTRLYTKYDKNGRDSKEADMYRNVLGGLMEAEGVDINNTVTDADSLKIRGLATKQYWDYCDTILGYKPNLEAVNADDKTKQYNALINAYSQQEILSGFTSFFDKIKGGLKQ